MKRVLILVAVLGAVAFAPVPAAASGGLPCLPVANGNGAASCTVTAKDVAVPIFVGPCLKPLGVSGVVIDANTVAHVTLLQTGPEAWFTTTATGPVAASSPSGLSGRATEWFGASFNNSNQVIHATADGQLTLPSGATFNFHEAFHFSTDAGGQGPVSFDNCSVN
jgi:hypothetical protein